MDWFKALTMHLCCGEIKMNETFALCKKATFGDAK